MPSPSFGRTVSPQRLFWCVILGALALYALYIPRFYVGFFNDDAAYILAAKSLLQGRYVSLYLPAQPPIDRWLPGYPILLAPIVRLSEPHWIWAQWESAVFTLMAGITLFYFWSRMTSSWVALACATMFLFNPIVGLYSETVMSDPSFMLAVMICFRVFQISLTTPDPRWSWGLSVLLAMTTLIRPVGMLLWTSCAVGLLHGGAWRRLWALSAPYVVLVGAVLLRNLWISGTPTDYVRQFHGVGEMINMSGFIHSAGSLIERFVTAVIPVLALQSLSAYPRVLIPVIVAVAFLTVWGWVRIKSVTRPELSTAMACWIFSYGILHAFWMTFDYRYALPVVGLMGGLFLIGTTHLIEIAGGSSHWRGWALGTLLLTALPVHAMLLMETYSDSRPAESKLPEKTLEWIRQQTPQDAIFISMGPTLTLYTGRRSYSELDAADDETFHREVLKRGVTYVLIHDRHILPVSGSSAYSQRTWDSMVRRVASRPDFFVLRMENKAESTRVYQVAPQGR